MAHLLSLVADKNMAAAISGLLLRPEALGIMPVDHEVIVHPERDPGCFHHGPEFLRGMRSRARHGLVVLDHAWRGVPADSGPELESQLEDRMARAGLLDWAKAVVIEPELEAWVFSGSRHVSEQLGWAGRNPCMREWLERRGHWPSIEHKPPDPKAAMERVLRKSRTPRSSSIYRELAAKVSTKNCQDRSFVRFRQILREWFPAE